MDDYETRFADIRAKLSHLKASLEPSSFQSFEVPFGEWVTASCPARLDFSGGWSDTPPICYEHGGAVVTCAVTVDGERPIQAACRRIADSVIRLESTSNSSTGTQSQTLELSDLDGFRSYSDPAASCSLLCAVIVGLGVVDPEARLPLQDQLAGLWKLGPRRGGLEMRTSVALPIGSGLGTSSILISAALAALGGLVGRPFHLDKPGLERLVHGTLYIEQLLSTGGGWQDQIGGVYPGVKLSTCSPALPLRVDTQVMDLPKSVLDELSSRLCLVYTGSQRLAKNLLRDVVTGWWYGRGPDGKTEGHDGDLGSVKAALDDLVAGAVRCGSALKEADWTRFSTEIGRYWELKRYLANPDVAEPPAVRRFIERMRNELGFTAASFAGAGGGGFLYAFCPKAWSKDAVAALASELLPDAKVFSAKVDDLGLQVEISKQQLF